MCWRTPRHDAIRVGRLTAVLPRRVGTTWELYDLDADSTETIDLTAKLLDQTAVLAQRFVAWQKRIAAE